MRLIGKAFLLLLQADFVLAGFLLSPVYAQQEAFNFVGAYKQAQDKRIEADKKLIENMELAADWLVRFKLKYGHFPEPGVEQDRAVKVLQQRVLKPNPYSVTGAPTALELKAYCPLRFTVDLGLTEARWKDWQKSPQSDWHAEPGSITIVSSTNKAIMIWAAGANHLPVSDSKSTQCYLAWREFN